MTSNPWEERMRARKAYLVSRVLLRLVDDTEVTVEDLVVATPEFRERVGTLAKTKSIPSERTWEIALELTRTELSFREPDDPFPEVPPTRG